MKLTALALAASLAAFITVPVHAADNPFASQGPSFKMAAADKKVPDAKATGPKCGGIKPAQNADKAPAK